MFSEKQSKLGLMLMGTIHLLKKEQIRWSEGAKTAATSEGSLPIPTIMVGVNQHQNDFKWEDLVISLDFDQIGEKWKSDAFNAVSSEVVEIVNIFFIKDRKFYFSVPVSNWPHIFLQLNKFFVENIFLFHV